MTEEKDKFIKFKADKHKEIKELADQLALERNHSSEALADVVSEAISFFKQYRKTL